MRTYPASASHVNSYDLLRDASVLLDGRVARILVAHGLTLLQFDAIRVLSETEGLRMSQLATRLLCDDSTLSRAVNVLVEAGWAVRHPDPTDRRAVLVRLTAAGRARLDEALNAIRVELDQTIGALADGSVADLERILGQLVGTLRGGSVGDVVC